MCVCNSVALLVEWNDCNQTFNYSRSRVLHGEILGRGGCFRGLTIGPDRWFLYASLVNDVKIYNVEDGSLFHTFNTTVVKSCAF